MAILKFKKKGENKAPVKKPTKPVEDEEVEEAEVEEEEDTEEEEADESEEDEEAEEEDTEEEADEEEEAEEDESEESEESEEDDEEEEEESDEEEEEEVKPKKAVAKKAAKVVAKKSLAPAKKLVKKTVSEKGKKTLKTGSLSSFGQKSTANKESFEFTLTIDGEEKTFTVPGKKPSDGGILPREALISILADSIKAVTGTDCLKKDAELLFGTFENVLYMATEKWSINFMGGRVRNIEIKERMFRPLRGSDHTFVPAHRELRFRRVCEEENVVSMKVKTDKKGQPMTDKKGNYIFK
jgi:flagellar biosynthesis GTPase FlhF